VTHVTLTTPLSEMIFYRQGGTGYGSTCTPNLKALGAPITIYDVMKLNGGAKCRKWGG